MHMYLAKGMWVAIMMRLPSSLTIGVVLANCCGHLLSTTDALPQSFMVLTGGPGGSGGGGGAAWPSMARGQNRAWGARSPKAGFETGVRQAPVWTGERLEPNPLDDRRRAERSQGRATRRRDRESEEDKEKQGKRSYARPCDS